MPSLFKFYRELLNRTIPAVDAKVPDPAAHDRGRGRSSPAYGPIRTPEQPSYLGVNLEPRGDPTTDLNLDGAELDQIKTATAALDSPCIGVCSTTFDDVCIGCGRTVAEVAQWAVMADEQKELVWERLVFKGYPRINKQSRLI